MCDQYTPSAMCGQIDRWICWVNSPDLYCLHLVASYKCRLFWGSDIQLLECKTLSEGLFHKLAKLEFEHFKRQPRSVFMGKVTGKKSLPSLYDCFGPFSQTALLVNKKSLHLQKWQCFELWAVFRLLGQILNDRKTERRKYKKTLKRTQIDSRWVHMNQDEVRWTRDELTQKEYDS